MEYTHIRPGVVPADAMTHEIPMRDGVMLAADRYDPVSEGPHPVILVRLPYDKDGAYCFMPEVARYLVRRDYVVVVQDVRGKYRSGGATEFAIHEVADGYDTIEWLVGQPWCDGSVVMWGDSYFGMTQIAAAASGHPALKAISPRVTGSQLSTIVPRSATTTDVDQTSRRGYFATHYVDNDWYLWPIDFDARPLADTFETFFTALGRRSDNYDRDLESPSQLRPLTVEQLVSAAPVPALYTIGWYDNCATWSWYDVDNLLADPRWAEVLHLRLEGIDHDNYRFAEVPIDPADLFEVSPAARARLLPRLLEPSLAFFDHWLGRSTETVAKVTYEVCHGDWHTAETWPPPQTTEMTFFAEVMEEGRRGRLVTDAPEARGVLTWTSDGEDLVPSIASDPFNLLTQFPDLAPVADRPDVVTVDSAPLDADLVVAGPVTLRGWLISDQPSTDLFARLLDVDPQDRATLAARGQLRFHELDGETTLELGMLPTAYRFGAGHRLRLHLASADFPEFTFNPGDGSDCWNAKKAACTTTRLGTGGDDGLRISFPVLPTT